jgi:hypothetical protein
LVLAFSDAGKPSAVTWMELGIFAALTQGDAAARREVLQEGGVQHVETVDADRLA